MQVLGKCIEYMGSAISRCCLYIHNLPYFKGKRLRQNQSMKMTPRTIVKMKQQGKRCLDLFMGLEGTLICSSTKPFKNGQQREIKIKYQSGAVQIFYIKCRPYLDRFLCQLSQSYNLILYTTQTQEYADPIIESISDEFHQRFYRYKLHNGSYVKELGYVTTNPHTAVLFDNDEQSIEANSENSVQITTYMGNDDDEELLDVMYILESVANMVVSTQMSTLDAMQEVLDAE